MKLSSTGSNQASRTLHLITGLQIALQRSHASYLNACIGDVADFFRVEALPLLAVEALSKGHDGLRAQQVDEGIAHIALVLEVNGQVKEIIGAPEVFINSGQEHLLSILVGDVLQHDGGPLVFSCHSTTM